MVLVSSPGGAVELESRRVNLSGCHMCIRNVRKVFSGFVLLLSCCFTASLEGAVAFSIDMDASTDPAMESNVVVASGGMFTAALVLEISEGMTVSGYGISVEYDPAEFTFVSMTNDLPSLSFGQSLFLPDASTAGTIESFNGFSVGAPITDGTYRLGTMKFTSLTGNSSGLNLFFEDGGFDGVSDSAGMAVPQASILRKNGTINAIPEPSSGLMLGLLACVVGGRSYFRKRSRADWL